MKILVLDATTKVLKADLAANPTTNPDYVISYADVDSSTFTEGSADGALTGTTSATLLTGLGSGSKRIVKSISIHNRDSNTITVYLKLDNNGTVRIIEKIVLAAGEAWHNDTQAGSGSARPGGNDTQVQFNDGSAFGGNSGLVFDKTTTTLTAANLVVSGELTVNGTTTNINSTNLVVEDKNIVIGDVATPTDTTANGGGITLLGATNKTIAWDSTNSNWTSSEHWNLASAKDFKINNVSVLNATTLGSSVTSSSLTSLGTLASLTVSGSASLATTSGSVGIGTSSPTVRLQINQAASAAGIRLLSTNATTQNLLQMYHDDTKAVIETSYLGAGGFKDIVLNSQGGNLGLGVTPSTWYSPAKAFQIGNGLSLYSTANTNAILSQNLYLDATATYRWITANPATNFNQSNGAFTWQLADGTPSANGAIGSFTTRMVLDASGNLGVGTPSPAVRLDVNGNIRLPQNTYLQAHDGSGGWTELIKSDGSNNTVINNNKNGVIIFNASNIGERARITSTGDLVPGANGTQNFGSSSLRWNTIYTSDLSLSNGIGDWTIVEGEDDLFIYNNKRNRVYKFKLEAVDPSTATPKREV